MVNVMGWKKLLVIVGLLLALLIVPVFSILGVVDVSQFSFLTTPAQVESSSSIPTVFVDPAVISDVTLQSGSYFTVHVNISDVTDLFTWQVNITWNPAILNFSGVEEYGPFLRGTSSPNGTSGWIDRDPTKNVTIAPFNNTLGFAAIAETILDSSPAATGVSGSGRMVSMEFLVVGYGSTDLTISLTGTLPTTLLSSTEGTITLPPENVYGGYFRNTLLGDMRGDAPGSPPDGDVDYFDFLDFGAAYLTTIGQPGYNMLADIEPEETDGDVDYFDFLVFGANYLTSI